MLNNDSGTTEKRSESASTQNRSPQNTGKCEEQHQQGDEKVAVVPATSTAVQIVEKEEQKPDYSSSFLARFLWPVQNVLPEHWKPRRQSVTSSRVVADDDEQQQQLNLLDLAKDIRREECLDLLAGAGVPLEHICYAFAYGSGAIPQEGENPAQKMVDFILVSNDSTAFHRENVDKNPAHYSWPMRALHGLPYSNKESRLNNLYWFQRDGFPFPKGARVFYNTMIPTRGRLIKYGLIEQEDFEADLLDWQWLYVAGRLHKPVLDILLKWPDMEGGGLPPNRPILQAIADNRWMATLAALIMMPPEFTMNDFLKRIVNHSYKGDVRMGLAEDSRKIDKLVAGAGDALREIYTPILKGDKWVHIKADDKIEQDYSTPAIYHRIQMLPYFVQRDLCNAYYPMRRFRRRYNARLDIEELLYFICHQHDVPKRLDQVLQRIVRRSSWQQSAKNALTAGFRSFSYIWPKLRKGILRR